jgi:hypothetical protein
MVPVYEYYKDLCKCASIVNAGQDLITAYDYYKNYCVCDNGLFYIGLRNLYGNEVSNWPVYVFNVNQVLIGYALNKPQYMVVWNSDPVNQVIGILGNGNGPFSFTMQLKKGQVLPPWVIGQPEIADFGIYESIYGIEYE